MTTSTTRQTGNQFGFVGDAVEQVRTPLLAALGAGDLATQAVVDVVNKARAQVAPGSGQSGSGLDTDELRRRLDTAELRRLIDVDELRKLVEPEELRKLVDNYTKAAVELYRYLAEQGEGTYEKARTQPQVKRALDQLEDALTTTQERVEGVAGTARGFADDVFARFGTASRSTGEKAARDTQQAAETVAEVVSESVSDAGAKVASETRSATRKAASKADAAGGANRKSTGSKSSTSSKTNGTTRKNS